MKHLRLALESEELQQSKDDLQAMAAAIEDLATIGTDVDGVPEDDAPSEISMESMFNAISRQSEFSKVIKFKTAMEDLSTGIWALIAAGAAALIAMIYKAVKWMMGTSGGGSSGGGGGGSLSAATTANERTVETIKDQVQVTENLNRAISKVQPAVPQNTGGSSNGSSSNSPNANSNNAKVVHNTEDVLKLNAELNERMDRFCEKYSKFISSAGRQTSIGKFLFEMVTKESAMEREVDEAMAKFTHTCEEVDKAVKIVEASRVGALGKGAESHALKQRLANINVPNLDALRFTFDFGFGKFDTFSGLKENVAKLKAEETPAFKGSLLEAGRNLENHVVAIGLDKLLTKLPKMVESMEEGGEALKGIEQQLAEIEKAIGVSDNEGRSAAGAIVRDMMRQISVMIQAGLNAVALIIHTANEMEAARKEHLAIVKGVVDMLSKADLDSEKMAMFQELKQNLKSLSH